MTEIRCFVDLGGQYTEGCGGEGRVVGLSTAATIGALIAATGAFGLGYWYFFT